MPLSQIILGDRNQVDIDMINEKRFDSCGVCGSNVKDILNFKDFPFAGKFTKEKCEQPEFIADLSLGMCAKCNHMQVTTIANPEFLYTKGYTYRTSKSFLADSNQKVFLEFINGIYDKYILFKNYTCRKTT